MSERDVGQLGAERGKLIVGQRREPSAIELETARGDVVGEADEAADASAIGIGSRSAERLEAYSVGETVWIEADLEHWGGYYTD